MICCGTHGTCAGVLLQSGSSLHAHSSTILSAIAHGVEMYSSCTMHADCVYVSGCNGSAIFAFKSSEWTQGCFCERAPASLSMRDEGTVQHVPLAGPIVWAVVFFKSTWDVQAGLCAPLSCW